MYREKDVDAYLLNTFKNLKKSSNEYQAIKTLLQQCNLFYWVLGKSGTLEMTTIVLLGGGCKTVWVLKVLNLQKETYKEKNQMLKLGKSMFKSFCKLLV